MRPALRRLFVAAAVIVLAALLLPYLIAPLYRFVQPVSTLMLWRWITGARVERIVVPLGRIAPALPLAVIVAEDGSFCHNRGIDLGAMREALEEADDIGAARGGSTITQQTVKNLFLWPGRSILRKALEIPLALWMNVVLPKRRVIEIYLNIAEWGPDGEFGAEAGARFAFGKSARDLSAREAAELAAILPNPVRRSARAPSTLVRRLAGLYAYRAAAHPALDACIRARTPQSRLSMFRWLPPHHSSISPASVIPGRAAKVLRGAPERRAVCGETTMAVPKRKISPSKRGMRRSADALKRPTYIEDKDSGELRRPHHIDLKTGMYRGRQVLDKKTEA